jgi:hypothetical protein
MLLSCPYSVGNELRQGTSKPQVKKAEVADDDPGQRQDAETVCAQAVN